jgi:predicted metal-dependent phosphoesterase TrpH
MHLTSNSPIDLPLHTTNSDGNWTPEQLLDHLVAENFALAAITDHDRIDTVAHVIQLGAQRGIPILPAVEMSCTLDDLMVDILCYGFTPGPGPLTTLANRTHRAQVDNLQEVRETLEQRGFSFPRADEVLASSNGELYMVSHLITLMESHGYKDQVSPAIRATNFRMITAEIPEVIEAAHQSGAVAMIAHPGRTDGFFQFTAPSLDRLRSLAHIDGLEILHPHHTPELADLYLTYAQKHNLLTSTGSDSHGPPGHLPIKYPASLSQQLLERCGITLS